MYYDHSYIKGFQNKISVKTEYLTTTTTKTLKKPSEFNLEEEKIQKIEKYKTKPKT